MLMYQEDEQIAIGIGQIEQLSGVFRNHFSHFAMVFYESFSKIVQKQRKMQDHFVLATSIDSAKNVVRSGKFTCAFHGSNTVSIDGVLMIFIELQKAPSVSHRGYDLLQDPQFMEPSKDFPEPAWFAEQLQETFDSFVANVGTLTP
jgi:hypothetical protein